MKRLILCAVNVILCIGLATAAEYKVGSLEIDIRGHVRHQAEPKSAAVI